MNYLGDVSGASSGSNSRAAWTMKQPLYKVAWDSPVNLSNFFMKSKVDKLAKFNFVRANLFLESNCESWIFLRVYVNSSCVYDNYFPQCFLRGLKQMCSVELPLPTPLTKKDTIEFTLSTDEINQCYFVVSKESSIQFY